MMSWHQEYEDAQSWAQSKAIRLTELYFTPANLLVHTIVYPVVMAYEGGDFHLFLDGISIEAVFVAILVGIATNSGKRMLKHKAGFDTEAQRDRKEILNRLDK